MKTRLIIKKSQDIWETGEMVSKIFVRINIQGHTDADGMLIFGPYLYSAHKTISWGKGTLDACLAEHCITIQTRVHSVLENLSLSWNWATTPWKVFEFGLDFIRSINFVKLNQYIKK